jgi:hypothetical protein
LIGGRIEAEEPLGRPAQDQGLDGLTPQRERPLNKLGGCCKPAGMSLQRDAGRRPHEHTSHIRDNVMDACG